MRTVESSPSRNQAAILQHLMVVLFELGAEDKALGFGADAHRALTIVGDTDEMPFAQLLQNIAQIRIYGSEYAAAEPLLREALKITLSFYSEDAYEVALVRGQLARVLFQLKQDAEAGQLFAMAVPVLQNTEEVDLDYFAILYEYGAFLSEKGRFAQALDCFEELVAFYAEEAPSADYAAMLVKQGETLDQLGRFGEALSSYEAAVAQFKEVQMEDSEEMAIAMNNLSLDLQKTGRFDEATRVVESLMEVRRPRRDEQPATYAATAVNYANLLVRKGEWKVAENELQLLVDWYLASDLPRDASYVSALESLSGTKLSAGDLAEARTLIEEAIALAEDPALSTRRYALYNQQARILLQEARFSEAHTLARRAMDEALTLFGEGALQVAYTRNTLAGILTQLGKYAEAASLYEQVLPVFISTFGSQHPEYATIAANFSSLLQLQGNYYRAEYFLAEAVQIKKTALGPGNRDFLTTYENLALHYLNTARYTEAGRMLEEIRKTRQQTFGNEDPSLAYTLSNLGNVKKQLADYQEAEKYFKEARDRYRKQLGERHLFYGTALTNLALLYQKMGNTQAAKPLFEQALNIFESTMGKFSVEYATTLENLATLYQLENDLNRALALLEEVLVIDERILGMNHPLYSKTLHNVASIYVREKNYTGARDKYLKALEIDRNVFGENHPSFASTLYNLAVLEQELENYDVAIAHYERVVDIRGQLLGERHPDYTYAQYGLASIRHKTGDFEEARPLYEAVTSQYLTYIGEYFPSLSESEKGAFFAKIKPVFDSYMEFIVDFHLLQRGTVEARDSLTGQLYKLQLATKALLLNAGNKVRNTILGSEDESLITLFNSWVAQKEQLVKAYAMSREELEQGAVDIGAMEAAANETEKQLSLQSAVFAGVFDQEVPQWQDVRSMLDSSEMAIEIIRLKRNMKQDSVLYIGLLLRPDTLRGPELVIKADGVEMEGRGFKTYKNSIVYRLKDEHSYDMFWKPFDERIGAETKTIYLSADGVINKVNLATLYDPAKQQYLVDRYQIRLLSNTRELVQPEDSLYQGQQAVLFGFPKYKVSASEVAALSDMVSAAEMERSFGETVTELPGTLEEVQNIQSILQDSGWQHQLFTGMRATEEQIKSVKNPKILHIATHGFFMEDLSVNEEAGGLASRNAKFNPLLRSGLLLAGAENTLKNEELPGEEDGVLTAYEAMNLTLDRTELVVMSACETGLGEVKNGEGVYGLQRSFMVAGASNLIMSLWKVNDETTQMLMSSFYKNWFGGQEKLEAFGNAIAEVRKNFEEPYYWGAFVMLGK